MSLYDIEGILDTFASKKIHIQLLQTLKSGKEAQVHMCTYNNQLCALKVYKNHEFRSFNTVGKYIANRYIASRTMRQAVRKRTRLGMQYVQDTWVSREFKLLKMAYNAGCNVPEVYAQAGNALLMEFIGDDKGPAPLLKEVNLTTEQAIYCFNEISYSVKTIFELGFVHSDLSPFNILWWEDQPVIIDFPQAVEVRSSPSARELLFKDFENIADYLIKYAELDVVEKRLELEELCRYI